MYMYISIYIYIYINIYIYIYIYIYLLKLATKLSYQITCYFYRWKFNFQTSNWDTYGLQTRPGSIHGKSFSLLL